jgi:hypothetical protein
VQGLGRPSPIGLKHSAIALSGDSEPITHLHTPPARGVQGCARVCKWVQHPPLVASRRAAPATQRNRCGSPRCVDRRHTEPSAGQSGAAQRRIDAESHGGQFAGTGRAHRPHSGQGVQGCARVCKGVQGVQLHSMASTIIAEQCKMRAIGFRVDWAYHRSDWVCSIRSI